MISWIDRSPLPIVACCMLIVTSHALGADAGVSTPADVVTWVYNDGWSADWEDMGYSPPRPASDKSQERDFGEKGGWIIANTSIDWKTLGDLTFQYKTAEDFGDMLEVHLAIRDNAIDFPKITISSSMRRLVDGWWIARIDAKQLNPHNLRFDRFRIRAKAKMTNGWFAFNRVGFYGRAANQSAQSQTSRSPSASRISAQFTVNCRATGHRISPYIYGIVSSHLLESPYEALGAKIARWGGNTSSRYNWKLGNAWNAGVDWFFRNINYGKTTDFSWKTELEYNVTRGIPTAVTIPMLGWVAKDNTSFSFPVSDFGTQDAVDGDAGNGMAGGKKLPPPSPTQTSVASTPEFVSEWIMAIAEEDRKRGGAPSVKMFFLDNEPGLWHDTHRDVHPSTLTYEELLEKTLAYATAVRRASPDALIAGPAEWGWSGYFYSPFDLEAGVQKKPDRRSHGDVPLVPWLLSRLAVHERKTGQKLLDVLDLHFYPQAKGIGIGESGDTDSATAALRIRSTRALWDPTYKDESWIDEPVQLLPLMKRWINGSYPGLRISIGEYNWGAEKHMSGGLALAEVLGRFGENQVFSAFYWRYPQPNTPAWYAFKAFGNYDDAGARFPSQHIPTTKTRFASVFAAKDAAAKKLVLIALNFEPDRAVASDIRLDGCQATSDRSFVYEGASTGFSQDAAKPTKTKTGVSFEMPPYSISVLEFKTP